MNFWHKLHDVNHLFPNVMVSVLFHKGTGFMWLNITNGETHKVHPITIMQRPASRLLLGMASWPLFYYNMYTMYLYTMKRITAKWKKERPTTDDKIFNQLSFQFMASLPNPFFFFFAFCFSAHYIIIVLLHTLYSHLPSFDLVMTVKISLMLGIKLSFMQISDR